MDPFHPISAFSTSLLHLASSPPEIVGGVRRRLNHVRSNFGESQSNRRDSSYHSSPKFPASVRKLYHVGFDFGALFSRFKIRKAGSRTAGLSVHFLFGRAKRKWTNRITLCAPTNSVFLGALNGLASPEEVSSGAVIPHQRVNNSQLSRRFS